MKEDSRCPNLGVLLSILGLSGYEWIFESWAGGVNQDFFGRTVQGTISPAAKVSGVDSHINAEAE